MMTYNVGFYSRSSVRDGIYGMPIQQRDDFIQESDAVKNVKESPMC